MTITDRFLESASWLLLAFLWALSAYYYSSMPETIPTHFNFKGEADDYGPRLTIFLLPAIASVITIGMTWLSRYPGKFNYPVKITEENVEKQQRIAVRLIRTLKLSMNLVFIAVTWQLYQSVSHHDHRFAPMMVILILASTMIPLVIYFFQAFRKS
jgi:uncharacterized membrane protein